jgi:hypothetical protein
MYFVLCYTSCIIYYLWHCEAIKGSEQKAVHGSLHFVKAVQRDSREPGRDGRECDIHAALPH